jgi:hypothetical protein
VNEAVGIIYSNDVVVANGVGDEAGKPHYVRINGAKDANAGTRLDANALADSAGDHLCSVKWQTFLVVEDHKTAHVAYRVTELVYEGEAEVASRRILPSE